MEREENRIRSASIAEPATTPGPAFFVIDEWAPGTRRDSSGSVGDLLAARPHLDLVRVTDDVDVRPDTVYLIPPGHDVTVEDGRLLVRDPSRRLTPGLASELGGAQRRFREMMRELERSNDELEQFAFVASHDLQEPLRKLISFSQMLEKDLGEDIPEAAQRDVAYIIDAANRMRALIRALLEYAKLSRSKIPNEEVRLDDCVRVAVEALGDRCEEWGALVEWRGLPVVRGNAPLLTTVFQNLISNALKFRHVERAPVVRVTAKKRASAWVLLVEDNGIGIEEEYFDQVFEPFKRLHARGRYEGSGIGLAICKRIVERHDGSMWLESKVGKGSRFFFTLPS